MDKELKLLVWAVAFLLVCPFSAVRPGLASADSSPPHLKTLPDGARYGLPPNVEKHGLTFARMKIPIRRADVRDRILKEINYLLLDRRSRLLLWLSRSEELKQVIVPILHKYGAPSEFVYLAAIESSYHSRALSPAGAFGYWQFLKSTAQSGPAGADSYDWKMSMTKWKDERADLIHSTHSAAKYLAWMNRVMKVKLEGDTEREGFNDWLLTAAAYNAGPKRVLERLNGFGATSYWDVPLPTETERYVPRWMAVGIISSHREFYGVQIPPGRTVSFDTVKNVTLKKDLTINALAEMLNVTPRAVWTLNTQIPPEKSVFPAKSGRKSIAHTIYVPKGARSKFLAQLKAHGYTDK